MKLLSGLYLLCISVPCMAAACVLVAIALPGVACEGGERRVKR